MNLGHFFLYSLRKEWDSNPRYGKAVRRISSPVHSITLASFLVYRFVCKGNQILFNTKYFSRFL